MEKWRQQIEIARDLWIDHINQVIEKRGKNKTQTDVIEWINSTYDYAFSAKAGESGGIRCTVEIMGGVSPKLVTQDALNRCSITKAAFDEYKNQHQWAMDYINDCEMAGLAEDIEDQRREQAYINKHFRDIGG